MTRINKYIYLILVFFLIVDLSYSSYQHFHLPLNGDISGIISSKEKKEAFDDPFGINVFTKNERHINPNRFFAYWTVSNYMLHMPILLQNFTTAINSVYLSCALAKIIIQIFIIYLLAIYISGCRNIFKMDFLIAATLITPLFQTLGYNRTMGIIDQSIIYTFFYALSLGLLLLFFLPFFNSIYRNKPLKFSLTMTILMAIFIIVLSFNGPLIPGIVMIICPIILFRIVLDNYQKIELISFHERIIQSILKTNVYLLIFFIGISLLSLYSIYIGQNNSLNFENSVSISERFSLLPKGILSILTSKLGLPLLLLMIIINSIVIRNHYYSEQSKKILNLLKWIFLFAIIYIFLLPFGGYRIYRPFILRYDTFMPITLGLMFIFGISTLFLIKNISAKYKMIYIISVFIYILIFTIADKSDTTNYLCERHAIENIAESPDNIVELNSNCPVMDWRKIIDYKQSELNAELFQYWNITKEKKLYYHKTQE